MERRQQIFDRLLQAVRDAQQKAKETSASEDFWLGVFLMTAAIELAEHEENALLAMAAQQMSTPK